MSPRASNKDTVDINEMSRWMQRDVEWLRHVVEYNFSCGCDFDYEDIAACDIWKAIEEMKRAEQRLEEAQAKHRAANNIAEV